jgi:NAD(P)H-hydrate epimerase
VDVPSGLDCDTGALDPAALPADLTVTFAAPKRGHFRFPGAGAIGELIVADIGIDASLGSDIQVEVATAEGIACMLPPRPVDAHKGTFGKAMIVAGSINYAGAPYLAAAAAARVGTGLVTLAPPQPLYPILASKLTEATFVLLPHNMGVLVPEALRVLASNLDGYQALLIGPGLGREKETVEFIYRALGAAAASGRRRMGFERAGEPAEDKVDLPPLVLDADALNALAEREDWWTCLPENSILTPHPGEMARLTHGDRSDPDEDRIALASTQAGEWRQIVVLKGAHTVVAAPDGRATVIPFANPGLATAGTGDVLAGAIVGLLAQGLAPFEAAVCGAYLHGLAGQIVAEQMGTAGSLAGDLLPALPQAILRLQQVLQSGLDERRE